MCVILAPEAPRKFPQLKCQKITFLHYTCPALDYDPQPLAPSYPCTSTHVIGQRAAGNCLFIYWLLLKLFSVRSLHVLIISGRYVAMFVLASLFFLDLCQYFQLTAERCKCTLRQQNIQSLWLRVVVNGSIGTDAGDEKSKTKNNL